MISFNDIELFSSGPHRLSFGPVGELVVPNAVLDPLQPGSEAVGALELAIFVRGRLVADSDDDLWGIRNDITTHVTDPPEAGSIKDGGGRSWEGMSFVSFTVADRTDHGRKASIAYEAKFVRFLIA